MNNPFRVRWLEGWTFQTVLIGGRALIEAYGFGVCLRTDIEADESPNEAADRLVLVEDRLRRSLRNTWETRKKNGKLIMSKRKNGKRKGPKD